MRELNPAGRRRIVILVTKEAHCLGDLLMKANYGGLDVEIAAVIGNHDTLRSLVERFDIPFELVSHEGLSRNEHDQRWRMPLMLINLTMWCWRSICGY